MACGVTCHRWSCRLTQRQCLRSWLSAETLAHNERVLIRYDSDSGLPTYGSHASSVAHASTGHHAPKPCSPTPCPQTWLCTAQSVATTRFMSESCPAAGDGEQGPAALPQVVVHHLR